MLLTSCYRTICSLTAARNAVSFCVIVGLGSADLVSTTTQPVGLVIAVDSRTRAPIISSRSIHVVNLGPSSESADIVVRIADSLDVGTFTAKLVSKDSFAVPGRLWGGQEGVKVLFARVPALQKHIHEQLLSGRKFSVQVELRPNGENPQIPEHTAYHQWGSTELVLPGETAELNVVVHVDSFAPRLIAVIDTSRLSLFATVDSVIGPIGSVLQHGRNEWHIAVRSRDRLPLGLTGSFVLALRELETDRYVGERTVSLAFDTIAPVIWNYRAELLSNHSLVVSLATGDERSGVEENGVVTSFSVDDGQSWTRVVHMSEEDHTGQPRFFRTTTGPLPFDTRVRVRTVVSDRAGNTSSSIPADFVVVAPVEYVVQIASSGPGLIDRIDTLTSAIQQLDLAVVRPPTDIEQTAAYLISPGDTVFERRRIRELSGSVESLSESYRAERKPSAPFRNLFWKSPDVRSAPFELRIEPWR